MFFFLRWLEDPASAAEMALRSMAKHLREREGLIDAIYFERFFVPCFPPELRARGEGLVKKIRKLDSAPPSSSSSAAQLLAQAPSRRHLCLNLSS